MHQQLSSHARHASITHHSDAHRPHMHQAMRNSNNTITSILHITSGFGLLAILVLICMFFKPDLAEKFQALSPFTESNASADTSVESPNLAMLMATPEILAVSNNNDIESGAVPEQIPTQKFIGTQAQQQRVTNWISKRYRVAGDAIDMLVSAAYLTAKETKLDPLLILSVIAIESRFNPFSESPVGAQGLMQVMSKVHHEKFSEMGGIKAALNPVANIKVGAMILKDYVVSAGSIEAGLKRYVGAADSETDGGYGHLVLAEYRRLKDVAAGKPVSIFSSTMKPAIVAQPETNKLEKRADELTQATPTKSVLTEQVAGI